VARTSRLGKLRLSCGWQGAPVSAAHSANSAGATGGGFWRSSGIELEDRHGRTAGFAIAEANPSRTFDDSAKQC
jgi:hypothetical protein